MSLIAAGSSATEHGFTFIGHDVDGWTVALIAAGIAAIVYEVTMALTKAVTLRIPFLVLQIARAVTPRAVRATLYRKWKADLWDILRSDGLWITKFAEGIWFAAQLALFGAVATARVVNPASAKRGLPKIWLSIVTSVALGVPSSCVFALLALTHMPTWMAVVMFVAGTAAGSLVLWRVVRIARMEDALRDYHDSKDA